MLSSSFYYSDLTEKFSYATDQQHHVYSIKSVTVAKKTANFNSRRPAGSYPKALKQCTHGPTDSNSEPRVQRADDECWEAETTSVEVEVEALLLLQKSMLEKQLELSFEHTGVTDKLEKESHVVSSGIPARVRRITSKTRTHSRNSEKPNDDKRPLATVTPELLQNRQIGRVRGFTCYELLTHAQVVKLSRKIRVGLSLDDQRSRLKEKLGYDPSDDELAVSLRMDRTKLRSKLLECNLAREKLAMSNVRLVISIAQKYDNMGADMADLVQGGLIGLLRGIEKFDSSKGFKISTYVYWWIRQGVCKALMENSRMLRLPTHLHERLSLIRGAKSKLKDKGINPSTATIAETLNMSRKKVENATEAIRTVSSLDSEPFPSFNGFPGKTYHSYIADNHPENIPWHGVDEWALKNEVSELIDTTLRERERAIIRLYHGLDEKSLTWEEISKRIGLSRERVRQVGLVAVEKLKYAARNRRMEALLLKD